MHGRNGVLLCHRVAEFSPFNFELPQYYAQAKQAYITQILYKKKWLLFMPLLLQNNKNSDVQVIANCKLIEVWPEHAFLRMRTWLFI